MGRGANQISNNYLYQEIAGLSEQDKYIEHLDNILILINSNDWKTLQGLLQENWLNFSDSHRHSIASKLVEQLFNKSLTSNYHFLNSYMSYLNTDDLTEENFIIAQEAVVAALNEDQRLINQGFPKQLLEINDKLFSQQLATVFQEQLLFSAYDKYKEDYYINLTANNITNKQQIEDANKVYKEFYSINKSNRNFFWRQSNQQISKMACNHTYQQLIQADYPSLPKHSLIPYSPNHGIYVDDYSAEVHYFRDRAKESACQLNSEYCAPARYTDFSVYGDSISWDEDLVLSSCQECVDKYSEDLHDPLIKQKHELEKALKFSLDPGNHYQNLSNHLEKENDSDDMTTVIDLSIQQLVNQSVKDVLQRNSELLNSDLKVEAKFPVSINQFIK
jgi:hypothetical protein